jgi:hypothetical protein
MHNIWGLASHTGRSVWLWLIFRVIISFLPEEGINNWLSWFKLFLSKYFFVPGYHTTNISLHFSPESKNLDDLSNNIRRITKFIHEICQKTGVQFFPSSAVESSL